VTPERWTADDLPALDGRTVIITGANSGIGLVAARALAAAGAHVVLAVRDPDRGERAVSAIDGSAEVRPLDLADLASVRTFADAWTRDVDVLVNNAGVMAVPLRRTADGFELQIGTNHLGHFALTNLLLPRLTDRVVTVASGAHRMGGLRLDDLNSERGGYNRWRAYGQSKLANLLFTSELERRLVGAGSDLRAVAAHPGWAATNLQSRTENAVERALMAIGNRVIAQSDEMGALPILYAATQDLAGDSYVGPGGLAERGGHPRLVGRSAAACDAQAAERLWALSERLTGVPFGLGEPAAGAS
jgi:NAD(P)-dependent dehydrogenase (short-subunit alcohol dehydrogenase family)